MDAFILTNTICETQYIPKKEEEEEEKTNKTKAKQNKTKQKTYHTHTTHRDYNIAIPDVRCII